MKAVEILAALDLPAASRVRSALARAVSSRAVVVVEEDSRAESMKLTVESEWVR